MNHIVQNGVAIIHSEDIVIFDAQSALDLLATAHYEWGCDCVAIHKSAVAEGVFILSTGMAGEILQKFATYRMKLAIIGDFSGYTSKPLRDFMYESNKGGSILFVATEAEAVVGLTGGAGAAR